MTLLLCLTNHVFCQTRVDFEERCRNPARNRIAAVGSPWPGGTAGNLLLRWFGWASSVTSYLFLPYTSHSLRIYKMATHSTEVDCAAGEPAQHN